MALHGTDLTELTNAESGTWTEFNSPYNGAGTPASETENFIQGVSCYSQTTGKADGLEISIVFDYGSNYSFGTDECVFAWIYYAVGTALFSYASGGWRFGIGSGTGAWEYFIVGGNDYGRNPYGGWTNIVVDPTRADDGQIGGGNGGNFRYFGSVPYTNAEITKGAPSAMDAIRAGRGELYCTGTGATFAKLNTANDQNTSNAFTGDTTNASASMTNVSDTEVAVIGTVITGTNIPANTTISSISGTTITMSNNATGTATGTQISQYNRLGLFQDIGGVYLWKGLLSFGQSATSTTFSDTGVTIVIDDTAKTYAAFNKIEVNNASSSVTMTNCSFIATGTVSRGRWENIADATVNLTGCVFSDMDTFIFDANTTAEGCTFSSCNQVTANEADLNGSSFLTPTVAADSAAVSWAETISTAHSITELDNCTFSMGTNNHHAVSFSTGISNGANVTLTGLNLNGFDADGTGDSDNSMFEFLATTGTITLTLVDCFVDGGAASESNVTVDTRAGCTVNVVTGAVTVKATTVDSAGDPIESARVQLRASDGTGPFPYADAVTISRSGTTATVSHTSHGMQDNDKVMLRGITGNKTADNTVHQITVTTANAYTFTTTDSGDTTYTGDGFLIDAQDETNYSGNITGGSGHAVNDVITLRGGAKVTVDAVSSGVVTQFTVASGEDDGGNSASDVQDQISSTGTGIDFSLTLAAGNIVTEIRSTFVALNGTTDVNGELSTSRVYGSNQPVIGWTRKSSASPYYKEGPINATVNSSTGLDTTVVMVSDE